MKVREDANVTQETKALIDHVVKDEPNQDRKNDRQPRPRCQLVEMLIRKGYRVWQQEQEPNQAGAQT
jgi:hypothetical protein